jgi:hypothetical protein
MRRGFCVVLTVLGLGVSPALAQSESDFVAAFNGAWQTLDPSLSDGGACRIELRATTAEAGRYALDSDRCRGALAGVARWGIIDQQLGLLSAEGAVLARLGGNQTRMSGDLAGGKTVVFERLASRAAAAPTQTATDASCVYYGYTASCARSEDRQVPVATGVDETARVAVLVDLNAREEARPDASVLATIPAGTCVVVDECTTASDGNWCRAKVSSFTGWIRQQAVRANRWPVLTFAPRCTAR